MRPHGPASGLSTSPLPAAVSLESGRDGLGVCLHLALTVTPIERNVEWGAVNLLFLSRPHPPPQPGEGGRNGHTPCTALLGLSRRHLIYLSRKAM